MKVKSNQEEWIKDNVKPGGQTQCSVCGQWISKYWKKGSGTNNPMTVCGPCDSK